MEGNFAIMYGEKYGIEMPNKEYKLTVDCFPGIITKLSANIRKAYEIAGINMDIVEKAVKEGKESLLKEAVDKKELLIMAKSAYVYSSLKDITAGGKECSGKAFESKGLGVMLRYDSWIFIKKLSPLAEKHEVSGLFSSTYEKLCEKYYVFKTGKEGKKSRKLGKLKEVVEALRKAYDNDGFLGYVEEALSYKSFRPYPYIDGLVKAYPDLKPKKPRGRLPGAGKGGKKNG
ncbi:MAG: hypothetical protein D6769_00655 [Methanobacteriota archaeon]|nr:MAG: hypothetical protein D6769_00655 [Euryarchaeota archaeon]